MKWRVGPYHSLCLEPMRMEFDLQGTEIQEAKIEVGFLHKALEQAMTKQPWSATLVYAGHLDPESSFFGEWVTCIALEKLLRLSLPPRAHWIRAIVAELSRLSLSLHFFSYIAKALPFETLLHYTLREREMILDLFELLTGSRHAQHFLRVGGVASDTTAGFLDRILILCKEMTHRLTEYRDILLENPLIQQRMQQQGQLRKEWIEAHGITGINALASGAPALPPQVTTDHPFLQGRQAMPCYPRNGPQSGDIYSRVCLHMEALQGSLSLLEQWCEQIPPGEFLQPHAFPKTFPEGIGQGCLEGPRGLLCCDITSAEKGTHPEKVSFSTPTERLLPVLPLLLKGQLLQDIPLLLASLHLSIAEVDR